MKVAILTAILWQLDCLAEVGLWEFWDFFGFFVRILDFVRVDLASVVAVEADRRDRLRRADLPDMWREAFDELYSVQQQG